MTNFLATIFKNGVRRIRQKLKLDSVIYVGKDELVTDSHLHTTYKQ